jgi:hypothetical protein
LAQSNSAAINEAMEEFLEADEPDIVPEHHRHWACGWVDGYAIRVYEDQGEPTEAFKAWCDIQAALENYPVLDEEDYSEREYEATIENIGNELHYADRDDEYQIPDDAAEQVFGWLWDNNQSAVENRDDQGGYPSAEEIREAFDGLGWRILWVVRWIDVGEVVECFDHEWEAEERCKALCAEGFFATFDAEIPDEEVLIEAGR